MNSHVVQIVHFFERFTSNTVFSQISLNVAPVYNHKGSGSHFDFCQRPCSSTCRWARLATHRHSGPHFVCIPCSHTHFGRGTTACVSSPRRRSSLHWLAHAARHGDVFGASTFGRSVSFVRHRSSQKTTIPKIAIILPETWLSSVRVAPRV